MVRESFRPVPRFRWRIAGLIAVGVLINYFDRISISVAGPQLELSFHLAPVDLGVLFSAFFSSYALLQIPAGLVLDRGECRHERPPLSLRHQKHASVSEGRIPAGPSPG